MTGKPVGLQRFDYASLGGETERFVRERAERIHNIARMTAAGIVQIGQYLTEVKERLKHGHFLEWIEREFGWSEWSARRFMNVSEHVKTSKLHDLQIDVSALYLIAAPSTPEPAREQIVTRARNGELITHAGTRALVRHFVETGEPPDIQVSLPALIERERRRIDPPAPVATEDRRRQEELRQEREANTSRAARLMSAVGAVKFFAETDFTMAEIARFIERYDTPDQNWRGKVKETRARLTRLAAELKL